MINGNAETARTLFGRDANRCTEKLLARDIDSCVRCTQGDSPSCASPKVRHGLHEYRGRGTHDLAANVRREHFLAFWAAWKPCHKSDETRWTTRERERERLSQPLSKKRRRWAIQATAAAGNSVSIPRRGPRNERPLAQEQSQRPRRTELRGNHVERRLEHKDYKSTSPREYGRAAEIRSTFVYAYTQT